MIWRGGFFGGEARILLANTHTPHPRRNKQVQKKQTGPEETNMSGTNEQNQKK